MKSQKEARGGSNSIPHCNASPVTRYDRKKGLLERRNASFCLRLIFIAITKKGKWLAFYISLILFGQFASVYLLSLTKKTPIAVV